MPKVWRYLLAGALVLTGCSEADQAANVEDPSTTVALRTIEGIGLTLVDTSGRTVYMTDQDSTTKIACGNKECTSMWPPLTVPAGQKPTAPEQIATKVDTVRRPDGLTQVVFDGRPLYTFSEDKSAGDVNGNGLSDSFGGPELTWHAMTPDGPAATTSEKPTTDDDDGYGY